MTVVLVVVLALVLTAVIAVPLLRRDAVDPLPDDRDPIASDLEEERDALLAAIRELDHRDDLAGERRDELRARYEAKAARVLRALQERKEVLSGRTPTVRRSGPLRPPWALLGLLVVGSGIAASLGGFVLPRVGLDALPITFFEEDLAAAERVRDLRDAARAVPSGVTYAALGDGYWDAQDAEGAEDAYRTAVYDHEDAPARAYLRLALLTLQTDLDEGRVLLEQARLRDPSDPNTLGTLGELYVVMERFADALAVFQELAALPDGATDPDVQRRIQELELLAPLATAAREDPSAETLLAFGDALWSLQARSPAVRAYFTVLTEHDPNHPTALARVGEAMFLEGRSEDAAALLNRARFTAAERDVTLPENALLFLGNAAFAAEDFDLAIDAWEDHLTVASEPGRVPSLIERAQALRDGEEVAGDADLPLPGGAADQAPEAEIAAGDRSEAGAALYAQYCAACHGPQGQGGAGPRLAGANASGRAGSVENLIRFGRGTMPGFGAVLGDEDVETLRDWVVATFGP